MNINRICLEWVRLDQDHVALIFNTETFGAFETVAADRGVQPHMMISEAVARLLGTIVMQRSNM